MYRLQPIQEAMLARVGFRQTTHPQIPQLLEQITESESGIFIQDRHPLLNTNNLFMCSENFDQWPYTPWAAPGAPGYDEDVFVKHEDKIWVSNIEANQTEPGTAPLTDWTEVNNFSQYLMRIQQSAAQKTVEKLFQEKKVDRVGKTVFENIHLFDGTGYRNQAVTKRGRFVGFAVRLHKQKHLTILLRKLGTQFDNNVPNLKIYVYHESRVAPVLTRTINHTLPGSFQWANIEDIALPYVSDDQDAGGLFFIGYYEDDLPNGVQSLSRLDYKWGEAPCLVCPGSSADVLYFQKWSQFSSWYPVIVAAADINAGPGRDKFANHKAARVYDNNFGLNFHLTLKCDVTDFLIENVSLLDEAYSNQIAYELLSSMSYTLRDNGDAKQIRDKAAFEMTRTDSTGISKMMESSYKALDFDMSRFNSICMPAEKRRGVRTGSMM